MGAILTRQPRRRRPSRPESPRNIDLAVWELAWERARDPREVLHPSDLIHSPPPAPPGDPTPEEIAAMCEVMQTTWTALERAKRRIPLLGASASLLESDHWTPPFVVLEE